MEQFRIHPLFEADIDAVIEAAGGVRAHAEADRRQSPGPDYVLGEAVIKLKPLDENGARDSVENLLTDEHVVGRADSSRNFVCEGMGSDHSFLPAVQQRKTGR
jgi:hypothetical protein